MAEPIDDRNRLVIPRWRPSRVAAGLGELNAVQLRSAISQVQLGPEELEDLQEAWKSERSPFNAAALIDAALVAGDRAIASSAAEWILEHGGPSSISQQLAQSVLAGPISADSYDPPSLTQSERYVRIATQRRLLRDAPRNALAWVDLAREYSILGHPDSASKAFRIALGLAPANRFVLRSACRYFLHSGDPEQAHFLLRHAPGMTKDPWLLAAEIVSAEASGRQSRLIKTGQTLLRDDNIGPRQLSELATAIGTLEYRSGNRKSMRRLLAQGLIDPTENAVAQVAWLSRHSAGVDPATLNMSVPRAFEARAWQDIGIGALSDAVQHAWSWLRDEPFATRPASLGAWITSTAFGDHAAALAFIEAAEAANPNDQRLLLSRFYNEASLGNVESARKHLAALEKEFNNAEGARRGLDVVLEADRGLLAFREARLEDGSKHYLRAIDMASKQGLREHAALALLNFARESQLAGLEIDLNDTQLDQTVAMFPVETRQVAQAFADRLRTMRSLPLGMRHVAASSSPSPRAERDPRLL